MEKKEGSLNLVEGLKGQVKEEEAAGTAEGDIPWRKRTIGKRKFERKDAIGIPSTSEQF